MTYHTPDSSVSHNFVGGDINALAHDMHRLSMAPTPPSSSSESSRPGQWGSQLTRQTAYRNNLSSLADYQPNTFPAAPIQVPHHHQQQRPSLQPSSSQTSLASSCQASLAPATADYFNFDLF